jgi:hypothetical protein
MATQQMSTAARAVERLLEQPLADFLAEQRRAGLSWDGIAFEIHARTGIGVTRQTIQNWAEKVGVA